mgnify:CR=1 FL=1
MLTFLLSPLKCLMALTKLRSLDYMGNTIQLPVIKDNVNFKWVWKMM